MWYRLFCFFKIYEILNFFHYLAKVWDYAKMLWEDWDCDYIYILRVLQLKLKRTRKCLEESYIDSHKETKKIKICELLIDRLIKDQYNDYNYELLTKKWGEYERGKWFVREKVITEQDEEKYRKELLVTITKEEYLAKQDIDMLFSIMNKHLRKWWN